MTTAIYVMANDAVVKWLAFFLDSLRQFDKDMPVRVIPYAKDLERVQKVCDAYGCSLIDYDFSRIDKFSQEFFTDPSKRGRLRKLAAFDGNYETNIYIDIDTIVTSSLNLEFPHAGNIRLVYGTKSGDNVYRKDNVPQYLRARSHGFSSGLLVFSKPITWTSADAILSFIEANRDEYLNVRAPFVVDQPLLNYYVDALGLAVGSVSDVWPSISPHNWYKDPIISVDGSEAKDKYGRRVLFIHWAGEDKLSMDPNSHFPKLRQAIASRIKIRCGSIFNDAEIV
jgi:lipopolysaccharide biosynthesis glycosyltransferase